MSKSATQITSTEGDRLEIEIVKAAAADVAAVRDLLIRHFGYIYINLLGNSKERASATLDSILRAHDGCHPLGYKSFYVSRLKGGRGEVVGILRLMTSRRDKNFGALVSGLSVIKAILQNLGLSGAMRALRVWRLIRGITPDVEAGELHVVYIAVADNVLKRQVGKHLLEHAKKVAVSEGKKFISLYVRAKNTNAQGFFLSQGFSVESVVTDPAADSVLKQGASIRMIAEVCPPRTAPDSHS